MFSVFVFCLMLFLFFSSSLSFFSASRIRRALATRDFLAVNAPESLWRSSDLKHHRLLAYLSSPSETRTFGGNSIGGGLSDPRLHLALHRPWLNLCIETTGSRSPHRTWNIGPVTYFFRINQWRFVSAQFVHDAVSTSYLCVRRQNTIVFAAGLLR